MRRLIPLVCALFALEASLYSTLAPLLPHYARQLGLSPTMAGVLTGAYSAGLIPGAVISSRVSTRAGVRATIVVGLVGLAAGSLAFGFAGDTVMLVSARAVQGIACGCVWGGGLAWLARAAPERRRGTMLGIAFGAATVGTLCGPALGTVALAIGPRLLFGLVAVCAIGLLLWVLRLPAPRRELQPASALKFLRHRSMHLPIWLNALQSLPLGMVGALIPLRLSHLGASGAAVAATFVLASCVGALVSPLAGRLSDRRGQMLPIRTALLLAVPCLLLLPWPSSAALVSAVTVVLIGGLISLSLTPAVSLIADAGDRAGVAETVPAVLITTVAVGETIGSAGGAGLGELTFDAAPFVVLAVLNLATAGLLLGRRPMEPLLVSGK